MHGDFSRWTFDPSDGYRAVLLQQGRVLLDADWNEQTQITARHDEVRARDIVGEAGGPLDGAGFALVNVGGGAVSGTAWADLRVTPGRFYVEGVLAEAAPPEDGSPGHSLADQPYLPAVGDLPGLPEPDADGRYAVLLDVWLHHVTADESPDLLESALGGPDTTTRARTVWQMRLAPVSGDAVCADVGDPVWADRTAPTMTASLQEPDPAADPCRISTAGGYQRLENQLYRVQIHDVVPSGAARYLWSRENGSVVAGLVAIGPPSASAAAAGMDAELTLDRMGRDEELSFREGDVVEVTSSDRQLHGLPGLLATAGAPDGVALPVRWDGAAPADLASLGGTPLARRWEGAPRAANSGPDDLEGGIRVRFGAGDFRVGDHWLIPARTVRLVYGVSALSGTIEWPVDGAGNPAPMPPLGPVHHVAPIALLDRTTADGAGRWTLVSDCRRLTPPLTALVTIDLLGGDGQAAPPGEPLPEPVRVAVRNGGVPVVGARVRFATSGGHLAAGAPSDTSPAALVVTTDGRGQADVRWRLAAGGPATQVMTARRLNEAGTPVDAEVRVTGRRNEGDSHCVVIQPGSDLVEVFDGLSGTNSVVLCLAAGLWRLERPAVLRDVGTVILTGAGAATRLLSAAESALRFEDCREVLVRDLSMASRPQEGDDINGALTVLRARRVHVERVRARVRGGPATQSSGVTARGDAEQAAERVVIRDCLVEAGDAQVGVLVVDSARTDITGCEVTAARDKDLVREDTFLQWLRDPAYAREVARRAAHPIASYRDRELGSRTGFSKAMAVGDLRFGSEIDDRSGWRAYLKGSDAGSVEAIQTRVRDDLASRNPQSRFFDERTRFAAWLRRVAADLEAGPAASAGIVVAGSTASDVRICDNTVNGALQGITVALSDRDDQRETVERLQVRGNTMAPPPQAATGFVQQGVYVGHCRQLSVASNVVTLPDNPGYAVEGVLCAGRLGPYAVATANSFDGTDLGIRIPKGPTPGGVFLHVARDNVCTTGPVLVDESGVWRDEGNVGM